MSVLAIDGLSLIRRVFEGNKQHPAEERVEKATQSAIQSLRRALRELSPSHAVCALDAGGANWRHALYPEYKATRPPAPDGLDTVVAGVVSQLNAWQIPVLTVPGVEADDVLGSLAYALARHEKECLILSTDKDFLQIVCQHTLVRNHFARETRDADWIRVRYGVWPEQMADLLALMGDAADNIPGVPLIGPKTAASLLNDYGTLTNLLESARAVPGKVGENLRAHADAARLSLSLVRLKLDVKLGLSLGDMRYTPVD